jgi:hypothetical protein
VRAKRWVPPIIKYFSTILKRALPMSGLKTNEETPKLPIRTPILKDISGG